jgi:hypothetical protein
MRIILTIVSNFNNYYFIFRILCMKFGFRIPSLTKRIAARTSLQRVIRHNLGFKAPKAIIRNKGVYLKIMNIW